MVALTWKLIAFLGLRRAAVQFTKQITKLRTYLTGVAHEKRDPSFNLLNVMGERCFLAWHADVFATISPQWFLVGSLLPFTTLEQMCR